MSCGSGGGGEYESVKDVKMKVKIVDKKTQRMRTRQKIRGVQKQL